MHRTCHEFGVLHEGAGHGEAAALSHCSKATPAVTIHNQRSIRQPFHAALAHTKQPLSQSQFVLLNAQQERKYTLYTRALPSTVCDSQKKTIMSLSVLTLNTWGLWLVSKKRQERVK